MSLQTLQKPKLVVYWHLPPALLPPSSTELHPQGAGEEPWLWHRAASRGRLVLGREWRQWQIPGTMHRAGRAQAQVSVLFPLLSYCSTEAPPLPVVVCMHSFICCFSWDALGCLTLFHSTACTVLEGLLPFPHQHSHCLPLPDTTHPRGSSQGMLAAGWVQALP